TESDPGRLVALAAHQRDRRDGDAARALQNAVVGVVAVPALAHVALDQAQPFDDQPSALPVNAEDLPALAGHGLGAGLRALHHLYRVTDLEFLCHLLSPAGVSNDPARNRCFRAPRVRGK